MDTRMLVRTALLASLIAVSSLIVIPIGTVPVTLQVMFVLLSGIVLGPKYGSLSVIIYILLGTLGLPVFAGGKAGIGILLGPTGGYLIGFILAAMAIGMITSSHRQQVVWLAIAMVCGIAIIYIVGVAQLILVTKMSFLQAIMVGLLPFIVVDLLKAIVVIGIARRIKAFA